jgi:hypothetical protein
MVVRFVSEEVSFYLYCCEVKYRCNKQFLFCQIKVKTPAEKVRRSEGKVYHYGFGPF